MSAKEIKREHKLLRRVDELLKFETDDERLEFKAIAIQLDILATVSELMKQNNLTRKDLAEKLGKSKSFISQLFSGDKMLNLKMIAKIQEILNAKFQSSFTEYSTFKSVFSKNDYFSNEYDKTLRFINTRKSSELHLQAA